nr:zinc finger, CCHC-type [Tanacetum cinerariifolium]
MNPELQKQFENSLPYEMLQELKFMFEKQARVERFDLIQTFHACKQEEGKLVGQYLLKMKGYVEQLERLGYVLPQDLSVGLIMNSLTSDFASFVRNYNKHNIVLQGIYTKGLLLLVEDLLLLYKLKLLDNAAASRLRLLEQSATVDDKLKKYH